MFNIIIAIFQIILAVGFIIFWIYFFKYENKNPERSEIYLAFERSFPIADLCWIVPTLLISSVGLLLGSKFGLFFTIVSGGSLIFLGLLDVSFNLRQGMYKKKDDKILNATINLICLIFGAISLIYGAAVFALNTIYII